MGWFTKKQPCVKCGTKTKRVYKDFPTCYDCELAMKMETEPIHECPVDGMSMKKEEVEGVIIDRCPQCKGVWLDGGELEHLAEEFESNESSFSGGNFASGLVIGMAMG